VVGGDGINDIIHLLGVGGVYLFLLVPGCRSGTAGM